MRFQLAVWTHTNAGLELRSIASQIEVLELGMSLRGDGRVRMCISSKNLNHESIALSFTPSLVTTAPQKNAGNWPGKVQASE